MLKRITDSAARYCRMHRLHSWLGLALMVVAGLGTAFAASTLPTQLFKPIGNTTDSGSGDYISSGSGGLPGTAKYFSYYIEVPPGLPRLVVDIFDADVGVGGDADRTGNRDWDFSTPTWATTATYRLFNPSGVQQTTVFSTGNRTTPAASDNQWLTFYDSSVTTAPAVAGSTEVTTDTAASLNLTVPTQTAVGDLLIAAIARDLDGTTGTVSAPAGWSLLNEGDCPSTACSLALFYRLVTAIPPSPQSFTWTGAQRAAGTMLTLRGVDSTTPFDGVAVANQTGSTTNPVAPGVTTNTANTLVIRVVGAGPNVVFSPPPSHTEVWDNGYGQTGDQAIRGSAATAVQPTAGATGSATFTADTNRWRTATFALRAAPAGSVPPGHWELRVDLSASGGNDINAFGLRAHDGTPGSGGVEIPMYYRPFTQYGTDSATGNNDQVAFVNYPYVTSGCECYSRNWDGDGAGTFAFDRPARSAGSPTFPQVTSFTASGATAWGANTITGWTDRFNAIEYGIWRLRHQSIEWSEGAGNIYTFYMTDFNNTAPPPTAQQQANSMRVYLPTDAGTPPAKPYLAQWVRFDDSGTNPPTLNQPSRYKIRVYVSNPTSQPITFSGSNLVTVRVPGAQTPGNVYYTGTGQVTQGSIVSQPGEGGSGAVTWNPGTVVAGSSAQLTYTVLVTPLQAATDIPVTGTPTLNGTTATYLDETGVATHTLGPLCGLRISTTNAPTQAVLSGLRAFRHRDGVLVRWETASEVGTAGFRLSRWDAATSRFVPVSDELAVALPEAVQGAAYELVDRTADPRAAQIYRVLEVEFDGAERELGVFEVSVEDAPGLTGGDPVARLPWRETAAPSLPGLPDVTGAAPGQLAAKIAVAADGVYYVSADALAPVLGLTPSVVRTRIQTGMLSLTNRGSAVAWLPAAGGNGLYFFGQGIDDTYAAHNIYRISQGRGALIQAAGSAPPPGEGLLESSTVLHSEVDQLAVLALPLDPDGDYWFWELLVAGDAARGRKTLSVSVPAPAATANRATISVAMLGRTSSGVTREHHVRVYLNGNPIGETWWEGITPNTLVASVSQDLLREGDNAVEVEALRDAGVPYSYVYVDSVDLSYLRRHEALASALHVAQPGSQPVTVAGFADAFVKVLDVTSPRAPKLLDKSRIEPGATGFRATFLPTKGSRQLTLASAGGTMSPVRIWRDTPSRLRVPGNSADYLVITAPELVNAAEGLADLRRQRGLRAQVVDLEDVYDEFSYGIPTPKAIRDFLAYVKTSWSGQTPLVVLAGAGTYDYKNLLGLGGNLVPPLLITTPSGLFSSDGSLADVVGSTGRELHGLANKAGGDGLPDLAIGRLPVATSEELAAQVEKIRAFENGKPSEWTGRALLVADNPEGGVDFGADSEGLGALLPSAMVAERVYLGELPLAKAREALKTQWNEGVGFVNYLGHGGLDRWAGEGLLVNADVPTLGSDGQLPLVASMTCVIGRFEAPGLDSLGEALVREPHGGAIAVWAASGVGNHTDSEMLGRYLIGALAAAQARVDDDSAGRPGQDRPTVGDLVLESLARYSGSGAPPSTGLLYNLLGDPALQLHPIPTPPPMTPPPGNDGRP